MSTPQLISSNGYTMWCTGVDLYIGNSRVKLVYERRTNQ